MFQSKTPTYSTVNFVFLIVPRCFDLMDMFWLTGMLAAQERLHGRQRGRCGVWRGALHSRNCGRLEPGQSDPGLQRLQGLHRWQPSAAGRLLNAVVDCKLPWCHSQALCQGVSFIKHSFISILEIDMIYIVLSFKQNISRSWHCLFFCL